MTGAGNESRAARVPVGLALALWGWQAGWLPWAVGMGVLLGAASWSRWRFEIGQADFNRLWNLTTLLFLGVALYLFLAREGFASVGGIVGTPGERLEGMRQISQTAVVFLRWLPFVLYPFMAVHAWSRATELPWSTFSLYAQVRAVRAPGGELPGWALRPIHPGQLYLALVLFSSCAGTDHPVGYLPLFMGVLAWGLWPWRSRRFGVAVWVGMIVVLALVAVVTQRGLEGLRAVWQALENRLLQQAGEGRFDQLRNHTALGAVGRLKRSGRIVLRVRSADGMAPGLLREAVFNRFRGGIWAATHREFTAVDAAVDGALWRLAEAPRRGRFLSIARYTAQGEAPLALPGDVLSVRDLPAPVVETNSLASARVRDGPPLALYTVEHGQGGGFDGAPEAEDSDVSSLGPVDRAVIDAVAGELGLAGCPPAEAVERVREYFAKGFSYRLWQPRAPAGTNNTALTAFLRQSRAGHCEYFATATALLLRSAGVPTRYAVGFSPQDRRGEAWLARGRDAHAWCLACVDGRWVDVDNTPGVWREREAALAGWWEGAGDWLSQAWYRFAVWRQRGGNWRIVVFAAGMAVLAWLGWRQLRGSRWRRTRAGSAAGGGRGRSAPGSDSEFLAVAARLERAHGERWRHETLKAWVRRLALDRTPQAGRLIEALRLHNRLRFDPRGLGVEERQRLRELSAALLREAG
jgi:transglutaminase-like putative cysteine protease